MKLKLIVKNKSNEKLSLTLTTDYDRSQSQPHYRLW